MENFFIDLYRSYLDLFFEPGVLNYGTKSIGTILYFIFTETFLLYFGMYGTFLFYIFYFIDNGVSIDFFGKEILIEYYHLFIGAFLFLFTLNILTFFVGKYFGRKREKVKSSEINFYIIFFQFFPIIGFLGNFIAGKNYEISLGKMLFKNIFAIGMIFLWLFGYFLILYFFYGSIMEKITYIFYSFISPIVIGLGAYFYYFKIKN